LTNAIPLHAELTNACRPETPSVVTALGSTARKEFSKAAPLVEQQKEQTVCMTQYRASESHTFKKEKPSSEKAVRQC
jgi:hypothetical protein